MEQFMIDGSLENPFVTEFLSDIAEVKERYGRLFSLWIEIDQPLFDKEEVVGTYTFETTSKDIFLGLGILPITGPENLAGLLELEFQKRKCSSLLISAKDSDTILVTRTEIGTGVPDDKTVTFTLSKAVR